MVLWRGRHGGPVRLRALLDHDAARCNLRVACTSEQQPGDMRPVVFRWVASGSRYWSFGGEEPFTVKRYVTCSC